jgi:hypothetical protein
MLPTNQTWKTMTSHAAPAEVSRHSSSRAGTTAVALNQQALVRTPARETSASAVRAPIAR